VGFGDRDLHIYSVHTETLTATPAHRRDQIAAAVDDIGPGDSLVVVGRDLNTVSRRSIKRLTGQFAAAGLVRVSEGSGPTISKLGVISFAADHILARGFSKISSGTVQQANASDHFPLWAQLALENKSAK
jgi:endonuclease/exonuclease/phosphatase (EEP) superfamily protein YafD